MIAATYSRFHRHHKQLRIKIEGRQIQRHLDSSPHVDDREGEGTKKQGGRERAWKERKTSLCSFLPTQFMSLSLPRRLFLPSPKRFFLPENQNALPFFQVKESENLSSRPNSPEGELTHFQSEYSDHLRRMHSE